MERRQMIAAAVAAAVLCFGGGALTMRLVDVYHPFGHGAAGPDTVTGSGWPGFARPRSAFAPRAGLPKPANFAVWRQRIDTSTANPSACVQMSKPLDPGKTYSDFVLVSPDLGHTPAVTVRNDELCVAGLGLADHRVTLLKGLSLAQAAAAKSVQEHAFSLVWLLAAAISAVAVAMVLSIKERPLRAGSGRLS